MLPRVTTQLWTRPIHLPTYSFHLNTYPEKATVMWVTMFKLFGKHTIVKYKNQKRNTGSKDIKQPMGKKYNASRGIRVCHLFESYSQWLPKQYYTIQEQSSFLNITNQAKSVNSAYLYSLSCWRRVTIIQRWLQFSGKDVMASGIRLTPIF
jgi:hypothetical protein